MGSFARMGLFTHTVALATWRKQEGAKNGTGLGKRVKTGGNDGFRRKGVGQRRVMCQARTGEGVFWGGVDGQEEFGWVQLTLTFFLDLN